LIGCETPFIAGKNPDGGSGIDLDQGKNKIKNLTRKAAPVYLRKTTMEKTIKKCIGIWLRT
jgi:hypothetical protein